MRDSRKSLILVAVMFVLASMFSLFNPFSSPTASALTDAEKIACYDQFNGKTLRDVTVAQTQGQCFTDKTDPKFCSGNNGTIVCPDVRTQQADAETQAKAEEAETAPLVAAACGTAPPTSSTVPYQSWVQCRDSVITIYNDCAYPGEGPFTGNQVAADATASCARPRINNVSGGTDVTLAQVLGAINAGRQARTQVIADAGTAKTKSACEAGGGTWENNQCTPAEGDLEPVCRGGALGWILCPLADIAVEVTDFFAQQIENILTFQPLLSREKNSQGALIYSIWSIVVGIANILLVIAFLIVVFSQATSIGLSNYGIKKMLPKIIAAAILMNLSFFICAIAVDISNVLGQAVRGVVQGAISTLPSVPEIKELGGDGKLQEGASMGQYIGFLAAGLLALGIAAATGALFAILPILVTAAMFILTVFVMLALRNVLITILIIAAPLAFVAMILPGTNGLFEKWRKLFIALLAVFPILIGLLYLGILLSHIIMLTLDPNAAPAEKLVTSLLALVTAFAGTVAAPTLLTTATGAIGRAVAGRLNDPNKGIIDRTRNKANEWRGNSNWKRNQALRKDARDHRRTNEFYERLSSGKGVRGKLAQRTQYGARGLAPLPAGALERTMTSGQQHDVEGLQRLAREKSRGAYVEEVSRVGGDLSSAGAYTQGSKYEMVDEKGNVIAGTEHYDPGRALAEFSNGSRMRVTNAAGKQTTFDSTHNEHMRSAAQRQAIKTGDGNAIGMILYGDSAKGVAATDDAGISEFTTWFSENPGALNGKTPHLLKRDNAFTAVTADQLSEWHGYEYKAAAARIQQLRSSGDPKNTAKAAQMEKAIRDAWTEFGSNDNIKGKMSDEKKKAYSDLIGSVTTPGAPSPVTLRGKGVDDYL